MINFLEKASKAYYEGNPIIDDDTFDALESAYPITSVGHKDGEAKHYKRLYSLDKEYSKEDIKLDLSKCIETPKLDGLAVSLLYIGGKLEKAITRGDGITGQDITEKMKLVVPETIFATEVVFIVGEVIVPKSIDNARNYAAGSLNLKDMEEFKNRVPFIYFVAYGSPTTESANCSYVADLAQLHKLGFTTVHTVNEDLFLTDGIVFRLNSNSEYKALGCTAKFPRGAVALKSKEESETKETTVLDVIWQLGASGALTPVALLEPIILEDAKVSRVTLHNVGFIEDMGIEIGCRVLVQRAGHIIPRVIGVL